MDIEIRKQEAIKILFLSHIISVFFSGCNFNVSTKSVDENNNEYLLEKIVIATYNTGLFFDTVCDSSKCSDYDFEKEMSEKEYVQKVVETAEALNLINADIVLLQEVEKKKCLDDLFQKMNGFFTDYFIAESDFKGSVNTAVITKGKILQTDRHSELINSSKEKQIYFTRDFLEVHIEFENQKIIVFSAHFKSKSNDNPYIRLAEAEAALKIVSNAAFKNPDALIVMGGDLNDTPDSDPIVVLESDSLMLRVASELPELEQATYFFNSPIAIDHIFFHKGGCGSYLKGSSKVIKDEEEIYSLGTSDHAALRASFSF